MRSLAYTQFADPSSMSQIVLLADLDDPLHRTQRSSTDRISSSPKSARSTASLASTVQARGRASSSLPQTPASLGEIDELKASSGKVLIMPIVHILASVKSFRAQDP